MDNIDKPIILIVDDVKDNILVLKTLLLRNNYQVLFATSGKDALEIISESKPDLILLDISMPEMDGIETCELIKKQDIYKNIPIIFLTAKSDENSLLAAFKAGAADYLTKPVNITELLARVNTHLKLKQSNDQLRTLLCDRAEFMGMAAHDMKNPLNSIISYTDLLISQFEDTNFNKEDAVKKLNIIKNSAGFMLDSVTEMLNHDTLESGFRQINKNLHSPTKIIESLLINNILWAESKNIQIKYISYPDFNVKIDEDVTRDIYQNILSNAIKYTHPSSTIWVSLSRVFEKDIHYLRFSVKDEGQGITDNDKQKLFKKMQKLSARPTGGEGSTGMGLYIVKKLTELHGGKVTVESKPNVGTEFLIDIPVENHSNLENLKFYHEIKFDSDYSLFKDGKIGNSSNIDYLKEFRKEISNIDIDEFNTKSDNLMESYSYIRKTNVINDIRKFANEVRYFGEKINSYTFFEYGDELNKLAITFDIVNLPVLLDIFPKLINHAIKK